MILHGLVHLLHRLFQCSATVPRLVSTLIVVNVEVAGYDPACVTGVPHAMRGTFSCVHHGNYSGGVRCYL
jgi:hypothetical protein